MHTITRLGACATVFGRVGRTAADDAGVADEDMRAADEDMGAAGEDMGADVDGMGRVDTDSNTGSKTDASTKGQRI